MWRILFLTAAATAAGQTDRESVQPRHTSLTNDPLIEGARLERTAEAWELSLSVRFGNECLADTGVLAEAVDLPLRATDARASLRVLSLRQRVNPEGCPDIYRPVTRPMVIVTRPVPSVRTIVLLNTSRAFSNHPGRLRSYTLEVGDSAAGPVGGKGPRIRADDLTQADYYPALENVAVSTTRADGGTRRYTVDFDVLAPSACHADGGLVVELRESTGGADDPDGGFQDWLFVTSPGQGRCAENGGPNVRKSYRVTTEPVAEGTRRLVIVNRLIAGEKTTEGPFAILEVK